MVAGDSSGLFRDLLRPRNWGFCALVVVVSVILRWPAMTTSLWVDELHTSWVVAGDWSDVVPRAQQGNQSPLYFLLLWAWVAVAGASEFTLRFPSLVAGVTLALAVGTLVRQVTRDPWLGLLAGLLIAIDSRFVFYATEARPYALLQCLAVVHVVAACQRWDSARHGWRLVFLVSGAGLFHLHYTGALLWGASATIALFLPRPQGDDQREVPASPAFPRRAATVVVDFVAILLLCSPAFPHLVSVLQRRQSWNSFIPADPPLSALLTSLHALHFVTIPVLGFMVHRAVVHGFPGLATKSRTHLTHLPPRARESVTGPSRPSWAMACWWLIPVMAAWLATRTDVTRLFFPRYLIGSAAGAVAWGATCLSPLFPTTFRYAFAAATLMTALWADGYAFRLFSDQPRPLRHEDWRGLARVIAEQPRDDERLLLVRSGLIEADGLLSENLTTFDREKLEEYSRYMFAGIYALPSQHWRSESLANTAPFRITPTIREAAWQRRSLWLAIRGPRVRIPDLAREILGQLADGQATWNIQRQWRFGNVMLFEAQPTRSENRDGPQS